MLDIIHNLKLKCIKAINKLLNTTITISNVDVQIPNKSARLNCISYVKLIKWILAKQVIEIFFTFFRGQNYFYTNFYAMFVSNLMGLILVLTVPTILDVLILTNKSSDPYNAFRRYLDTIRHMLRWYNFDLKNPRSKWVEPQYYDTFYYIN